MGGISAVLRRDVWGLSASGVHRLRRCPSSTGDPGTNFKNILRWFIIYFALVFFVTGVVSYLYSFIAHGQGIIDWEAAIRFALIFGITLPIVRELENRDQ
jgi:hypothetical protein